MLSHALFAEALLVQDHPCAGSVAKDAWLARHSCGGGKKERGRGGGGKGTKAANDWWRSLWSTSAFLMCLPFSFRDAC